LSPYVGSAAETTWDIATLNKRVHQIMSRNPMTLHPEAKIEDCVQLFQTGGRGRLARSIEFAP
jgi:acetoin utilization protein AcuB